MKCSFGLVWVYVMDDGQAFKIGHSVDTERRVVDLQPGNPGEIRVIYKVLLPMVAGLALERALHAKYVHLGRKTPEWYDRDLLPLLEVFSLMKEMAGDAMWM